MKASERVQVAAGLLLVLSWAANTVAEHLGRAERRELSDTVDAEPSTPPAGPCAPCMAARLARAKREREQAEAAPVAAPMYTLADLAELDEQAARDGERLAAEQLDAEQLAARLSEGRDRMAEQEAERMAGPYTVAHTARLAMSEAE